MKPDLKGIIRTAFFLMLLFFLPKIATANHLAGGYITYQWISGNTYEITLVVYRDCAGNGPALASAYTVYIYNSSGAQVTSISLTRQGGLISVPLSTDPCVQAPPVSLYCLEKSIYKNIVTLQPSVGGYTITFKDFARNTSINNLVNPGGSSFIITASIPNPMAPICTPPPGYAALGGDCNDGNNAVHPGMVEICDNIDNNCNGMIDEGGIGSLWYEDNDGDGYGNPNIFTLSCNAPSGYVADNTDCNDSDNTINPGIAEICDGIDNDCNGIIDDGVGTVYYADIDGDGFGDPGNSLTACTAPAGYTTNNTDCNDNDASVYPGAPEICDGLDNDCNGLIDDNTVAVTWYPDNDGDGYGVPGVTISSCIPPVGYSLWNTDCNDNDNTIYPGAPELCDNLDNNCNGQIDEGAIGTVWYRDRDGDEDGDPATSVIACVAPPGYVASNTDCDDYNRFTYPGAPEICDGQDNDCNGLIDDNTAPITWYQDADGDGYGNPLISSISCTPFPGYVQNNLDCNDNNIYVYSGAPEICDGLDNDCNGLIDDNTVSVWWYEDLDGDGYGNTGVSIFSCTPPAGYVLIPGDCNDNSVSVYPGAPELCDLIDNDCDGVVDNNVTVTWYLDKDGDGYGDPAFPVSACFMPGGYVGNNTDCDDNNYYVNPGRSEVCDNLDNDCNGLIDDGAFAISWFLDADADGYGDSSNTIFASTTYNSGPNFVNDPPVTICVNNPMNFNTSAIDPNGDSLSYSLCNAMGNAGGGVPGPPPYPVVNYQAPFNGLNPMPANPALSIDPVTGIITGIPTSVGLYVVVVCIKEYRNGVLIGSYMRDLQIYVNNCIAVINASTDYGEPTIGVSNANPWVICDSLKVDFNNNSTGTSNFFWDFGVAGTNADTSNLASPSFTYPDTGTYLVQLIAGPGQQCADTTFVTLKIYPSSINADFSFVGNPCVGNPINLVNTSSASLGPVNYSWNISGTMDTAMQPAPHLFNPAGNHQVKLLVYNDYGCRDSITKTILINQLPMVIAGPDVNVCPGDSVQLNVAGFVNFSWSPGTTLNDSTISNPYASPLFTTTYTVTGTNSSGCSKSDSVTVTVDTIPVLTLTPTDPRVCEGDTVLLTVAGANTYSWSPAAGLSDTSSAQTLAFPTTTITYYVTGTVDCSAWDSITVFVDPTPIVTISNDTTICINGSAQLNASGGDTYIWQTSSGLSNPNIANPVASPTTSTIYTVTATDSLGCEGTATVAVDIFPVLSPNAGPDTAICFGDTVRLFASNGLTYSWEPAGMVDNNMASQTFAVPGATTIFTVSVLDNYGCTVTDMVNVQVNFPMTINAGPDIHAVEGTQVVLNASGGVSYIWDPAHLLKDPGTASPTFVAFDTLTFSVIGMDMNGCYNSDEVTVFLIPKAQIFMPTAFSPNGDGRNDIFKIGHEINFELISMQIYNRWGELLFTTKNISDGWNGKYNGLDQPIGTYMYLIRGINEYGEEFVKRGNITLLR